MTAKEIAEQIHAELIGNGDTAIVSVAKIEEAQHGQITFIANSKYNKYLETTEASAVILSKSIDPEKLKSRKETVSFLLTEDPYNSFLRVLKILNPEKQYLPVGIHTTAVISDAAKIGEDVRIGAHAVIGDGCSVGNGTAIGHGTVIEDNVHIGDDCILYPNVTIRDGCQIGSRVIIHSGTIVGSDGFGFVPNKDGTYDKIPQVGIVVIEDDVEIGSNCSIDRATMGETKICKGAKLDNLIQIAHNVVVGEHTVIAAQTGISGSTKIGKHCIIAGQVGFVGHIEIADHVTIGAQSGVSKSIPKKGIYFGFPAKEHTKAFRIEAALRQLPDLINQVNKISKKLNDKK